VDKERGKGAVGRKGEVEEENVMSPSENSLKIHWYQYKIVRCEERRKIVRKGEESKPLRFLDRVYSRGH